MKSCRRMLTTSAICSVVFLGLSLAMIAAGFSPLAIDAAEIQPFHMIIPVILGLAAGLLLLRQIKSVQVSYLFAYPSAAIGMSIVCMGYSAADELSICLFVAVFAATAFGLIVPLFVLRTHPAFLAISALLAGVVYCLYVWITNLFPLHALCTIFGAAIILIALVFLISMRNIRIEA